MHLNPVWRVLSFLALLLYVVLVVVFVLLLVRNIGMAIILGTTSLLLVYAAWLLFSGVEGRARRGRWLVAVFAVGMVIELVYFLADQRNRRALFAIAGLTVLYMLIFGLLRKKYWTTLRQQGEVGGNTAQFKNPYLIINPKAGNGRAAKAHLDELAKQQGIQVVMTQEGVDIAESALQAVQAGADVIGISGGDGSIGAVAKVAIDHGLPIVVLPGGTKCHFARDIGLDPGRIVDALAGFWGVERRVDVGVVNGRIFLNNASFGLYADIVDHPEYREHKLQIGRRVLQAIASGAKEPYDLRFGNGTMSDKKAVQILVGVNRYNTMNLFELGQRQRLDEGVLQITAITKLNDQLVRQLLSVASIKQLTRQASVPGLDQWVDTTFTVASADKEIAIGIDGEREVYETPVKITILPRALRIYVPAEGARGRPKNPFDTAVVRQIQRTVRG